MLRCSLALVFIRLASTMSALNFMSVQVESCTPGTLLTIPGSHLAEPQCVDATLASLLDRTDIPLVPSTWPTATTGQLWRFTHNIIAPIPSTTGFIVRLSLLQLAMTLTTTEAPASPRAVGMCLRASSPTVGTVLQLSAKTTAPNQGLAGFCQVFNAATPTIADTVNRDPPPNGIVFANPNGFGFQMKRTSTSGPFVNGHLCPATGGIYESLRAVDAVVGGFEDERGNDDTVMAFTGPNAMNCAVGSAVGMPSGSLSPERQAYGFHITCQAGSIGTTGVVILTFLSTLTLDQPSTTLVPPSLPWDPSTSISASTTWPFAVVSISFTCTGPPNVTVPSNLYLGPTNASTFCGAQVCPPFRSVSSAIPGVMFYGSCAA